MMHWGIREKFLAVFILGVTITLLLAGLESYTDFEKVYTNINEHSMNAEFNHISYEIEALLSETDKRVVSEIASVNGEALARYGSLSMVDRSTLLRKLGENVRKMIESCPEIDSLVVYLEGDWLLCFSGSSVRQYASNDQDWISDRMEQYFLEAEYALSLVGNATEYDFPIDFKEEAYLTLYRKMRYIKKECVYSVNIKESALFDVYNGFMREDERVIRLLDRDGMIISSGDKSEIGSSLTVLADADLSKVGTKTVDGVLIDYRPIGDGNIVIVNTIPVAVYTRELVQVRNKMLCVIGAGLLIICGFLSYWIRRKLQPLEELQDGMRRAGLGEYVYLSQEDGDEIGKLMGDYNIMLTDLQKLREEQQLAERELAERELAILRNEINPHFLYNTLNTMKCMAELDGNHEIARGMLALGGIIAPLYKDKNYTWSLRKEMQVLEQYMEIMRLRYGNGIECMVSIPEKLLEWHVLKFILQPIVENSILHGFSERGYEGHICITVKERENNLQIFVEDDGVGMTDEELEQYYDSMQKTIETDRVGVRNVNRRLALRYGAEYGLWMKHSAYGGLCTLLRMPVIENDVT